MVDEPVEGETVLLDEEFEDEVLEDQESDEEGLNR